MKLALALLVAGLSLHAQSGRTVAVTWDASTTPGAIYNIYRAPGACAPTPSNFTRLNASSVDARSYNDANVPFGTYCYVVKAFANGAESPASNTAMALIQTPVPPPIPDSSVMVTMTVTVAVDGVTKSTKDVVITVPVPHPQ